MAVLCRAWPCCVVHGRALFCMAVLCRAWSCRCRAGVVPYRAMSRDRDGAVTCLAMNAAVAVLWPGHAVNVGVRARCPCPLPVSVALCLCRCRFVALLMSRSICTYVAVSGTGLTYSKKNVTWRIHNWMCPRCASELSEENLQVCARRYT